MAESLEFSSSRIHRRRDSRVRLWLSAGCGLVFLFLTSSLPAAPNENLGRASGSQRKALVLGSALRAPGEWMTHPEGARKTFLKLVGNPANNPANGWTCDLSWDLMLRLGMNPTNTPIEELFQEIGRRRLGYRIVINNSMAGAGLPFWGVALDNGMMPFAPQGNNTRGLRMGGTVMLGAPVSVAGGSVENITSFGNGVELIDALPLWASHANYEDAAQSWANQVVAAKFARILDAHPGYNIWDARQHLRQAASFWARGWDETNGFGRVNEKAVVNKLLPGAPVQFFARKSRSRRQVSFTWRNFLQSDFAATVIARKDGRIIYEGAGTNFTWTSDVDGDETFRYWTKNKAGERSRIETWQTWTITGLNSRLNQTCLVLGAPRREERNNSFLQDRFQKTATNWVCDMVYRRGNPFFDALTRFPQGPLAAVLPDFPAMVDFAISNQYRMIIVPASQEEDLFQFKRDWDRASATGILVVLPHYIAMAKAQAMEMRTLSPPRLFSAMTVGTGDTNYVRSFGPGLEFVSSNWLSGLLPEEIAQVEAAILAGRLAQILDTHPGYNVWDARQHLRQSASGYAAGWREEWGYGRPSDAPVPIAELDPAPPLDLEAVRAPDGKSVTFSWLNFRQSSFAETVIQRDDGRTIYHGTGTNFTWRSDVEGTGVFQVHSRDKSGRLSRTESYTRFEVPDLGK